jgi:hypothetical protein
LPLLVNDRGLNRTGRPSIIGNHVIPDCDPGPQSAIRNGIGGAAPVLSEIVAGPIDDAFRQVALETAGQFKSADRLDELDEHVLQIGLRA